MTQKSVLFTITQLVGKTSGTRQVKGVKIFNQLTTLTIRKATSTGGSIDTTSKIAGITASGTVDFPAICAAVDAMVIGSTVPLTITYDDPGTGDIVTVLGLSLTTAPTLLTLSENVANIASNTRAIKKRVSNDAAEDLVKEVREVKKEIRQLKELVREGLRLLGAGREDAGAPLSTPRVRGGRKGSRSNGTAADARG
jgi:hypothetical protein